MPYNQLHINYNSNSDFSFENCLLFQILHTKTKIELGQLQLTN